MSMIPPPFTGEQASKAMLEGLTSRIREELKRRILERIEPDVDAAVEASLQAFKVTIESYREAHNMRDTVRVLIERRDVSATLQEGNNNGRR